MPTTRPWCRATRQRCSSGPSSSSAWARRSVRCHPGPSGQRSRSVARRTANHSSKARSSRASTAVTSSPVVTAAPAGTRRGFVVVGVDPTYLHLSTLPRDRPAGRGAPLPCLSAGRPRTAPRPLSMQRARSAPTSSSVSVRSGAAEAQAVGQAAGALGDPGPAVHVEEGHRLEQIARRRHAGPRRRRPPGGGPPPRRRGRCPRRGSG